MPDHHLGRSSNCVAQMAGKPTARLGKMLKKNPSESSLLLLLIKVYSKTSNFIFTSSDYFFQNFNFYHPTFIL
jgi:hypothetical protein